MKKRSGLAYFLREIIIVVIGVLVAVSIGNYKERVENQQYIEKTLLATENEIKLSQEDLDTILERHLELFKTLEEEIGENEQTLGEFVSSAGGFQVPAIKNISLRFFIANKAELVEFELISQLLAIETQIDLLYEKSKMLADFAYEHVQDSSDETKIKFAYFLSNVIDGEQTLLKSYASFLKDNKDYLNSE